MQASRFCGLLDQSVAAHRRARALDSRAVTSVPHTYFLMGDYEKALEAYEAGFGYYLDAAILAATCRESEAAALLALRHSSGVRSGWMRTLMESLRALLESGDARCLVLVQDALAEPAKDPECKFYLARHLARAGAHTDALAAIRELSSEGLLCSCALQRDPWWQPLSRLPEYSEVLRAIVRRESEAHEAFVAAGGPHILS